MKATPKLIQYALGAVGIGTDLETCIKIHEVVKLLNEKGDEADIKDLSKIAAIQVEDTAKDKAAKIDLRNLEAKDRIRLKNGDTWLISKINNSQDGYRLYCSINDTDEYFGLFSTEGCSRALNEDLLSIYSSCDIIEIIKPAKP